MADWKYDEKRFIDEVVKPVKEGWQPTDDLFRVYLLADTVTDAATITAALDGIHHELGGQRLKGAWAAPVGRLRAGHEKAKAVLTDAKERREHAQVVRRRRELLQQSLSDRLAGAPGLPQRVIATIAAESRGSHTHNEIRFALAEVGASTLEPHNLPEAAAPAKWAQMRSRLSELGQADLWTYLATAPLKGASTTEEQLNSRLLEVRKRHDAAATSESSLIEEIRALLKAGKLQEALRFELCDGLQANAAYRYPVLLEAAKAITGRLTGLGVQAKPDVVAYAIWCRHRYAEAGSGTGWKITLREALAAKDLRLAVSTLSSAGKLSADEDKQLKRITAQLLTLDAELSRAAGLETKDPEAAAAAYLAVGSELRDPAVEIGLARCTPGPVNGVNARLDGNRVVISWQPSPARAGRISYLVVRAAGHRPSGPADGTQVAADLKETGTVDAAPPGAQQLYYAVFTQREGGARSSPVVSQPVLVLQEVTDLVLEPTSDSITGRWRAPAGASGIEVTRRPVGGAGRATTVPRPRGTGFTDTDVQPGERYEYRIQVRYRLPDGTSTQTPGLAIEGGCQEVPVPVTALDVQLDGDDLVVSWQPPARGDVEIRDLVAAGIPERAVVPLSSLERLGRELTGVSLRSRSSLRVRPSAGTGRMTLLAVTVLGDLAALGAGHVVDRRLRPVTDLLAVRHGSEVQLTWAWPDGVNEARLLYSSSGPPNGPQDRSATWRDVTRVAYDTVGVRLRISEGAWHFAVCTLMLSGREQSFGPLVGVAERSLREVGYRIERVGWRGRRHRVSLGVEGGPPLPAMALMAKARTRPIARSDGQEVLRLPAGADQVAEEFEPPPGLTRPVHLRLFSLEAGVVLVPEHPDQLIVT